MMHVRGILGHLDKDIICLCLLFNEKYISTKRGRKICFLCHLIKQNTKSIYGFPFPPYEKEDEKRKKTKVTFRLKMKKVQK